MTFPWPWSFITCPLAQHPLCQTNPFFPHILLPSLTTMLHPCSNIICFGSTCLANKTFPLSCYTYLCDLPTPLSFQFLTKEKGERVSRPVCVPHTHAHAVMQLFLGFLSCVRIEQTAITHVGSSIERWNRTWISMAYGTWDSIVPNLKGCVASIMYGYHMTLLHIMQYHWNGTSHMPLLLQAGAHITGSHWGSEVRLVCEWVGHLRGAQSSPCTAATAGPRSAHLSPGALASTLEWYAVPRRCRGNHLQGGASTRIAQHDAATHVRDIHIHRDTYMHYCECWHMQLQVRTYTFVHIHYVYTRMYG